MWTPFLKLTFLYYLSWIQILLYIGRIFKQFVLRILRAYFWHLIYTLKVTVKLTLDNLLMWTLRKWRYRLLNFSNIFLVIFRIRWKFFLYLLFFNFWHFILILHIWKQIIFMWIIFGFWVIWCFSKNFFYFAIKIIFVYLYSLSLLRTFIYLFDILFYFDTFIT